MPVSRIWELLARKYNQEITTEELRELELLLQQHKDVFEVNEILLSLHELPLEKITTENAAKRSRDFLQARITAEQTEQQQAATVINQYEAGIRSRKTYRWLIGVAGVAASVLLLTWGLKHNNAKKAFQGTQMNEVVTTGGSKSTIHLPDGSSVILNTGSKLTYNKDFGVSAREIYLKGEAFFDIQKNENLPLTVHAGNIDIRVKGTAFNVKAYTEDSTVEASLIHGAIEIFSQKDPERKILLRPNEKILVGKSSTFFSSQKVKPVLKAEDEEFVLAKIKPNPVDSSINEIAWIENKLAFYKEPFGSLAKKMERWYNVSIHFKDASLNELTFTGSFEKEDILEALDALRQTTNFDYSVANRNIVISKHQY